MVHNSPASPNDGRWARYVLQPAALLVMAIGRRFMTSICSLFAAVADGRSGGDWIEMVGLEGIYMMYQMNSQSYIIHFKVHRGHALVFASHNLWKY